MTKPSRKGTPVKIDDCTLMYLKSLYFDEKRGRKTKWTIPDIVNAALFEFCQSCLGEYEKDYSPKDIEKYRAILEYCKKGKQKRFF